MRLPAALLPHRVTITPVAGHDGYGRPIEATPAEVPAMVDWTGKRVTLPNGSVTTIEATVAVQIDVDVEPGYKVTLPGPREVTIITVKRGMAGHLPVPQHIEFTTA